MSAATGCSPTARPIDLRAHSTLADDLLAERSDPLGVEPDLPQQVATSPPDSTARGTASADDGYGIDLW